MNEASDKRRFELEALEPRCLLSSGAVACAAAPLVSPAAATLVKDPLASSPAQTSQSSLAYDPAALIDSIFPAETQPVSAPPPAVSDPATGASNDAAAPAEGPQKQSAPTQKSSATGAAGSTGSAQQSGKAAQAAGGSQVLGNPSTQQLTNTLKAANGPPAVNSQPVGIVNVPSFTQGPDGVTVIQIGGPAGPGVNPDGWDQINAGGLAQLDGTLKIQLASGFVPTPGQSFKILTWNSRQGEFANWLGTVGIPGHPDYYFKPVYHDKDLSLEVVADPDILGTAKTQIENGLATLAQIGTLLNNVGSFAQNIPLIGDKLSSFINSGSAIDNVIRQQIQNLLNSGPTAEAAVTSAIQSWDGQTVGGFAIKVNGVLGHYDATGTGPFWWDLSLDITPAAINKTLTNIASAVFGATMPSPPSVSVQGKLSVNMSFGYDSVFFVKLDHLTAEADVTASGLNSFPVNLSPPGGGVSLSVTNGSVALTASITATPDPSVLTASATTGARIEASTLATIATDATHVSDAFNLTKTSTLNAAFTLGGGWSGSGFSLSGTTTLDIQSSDLFNGATPDVTLAVNGSLVVLNESLTGTFTFKKTATETDVEATGVTLNIALGTGGGATRILQATGSGEFVLFGSGGLAGTASLTLTQGPNIPGLSLTGTSLTLAVNTSNAAVPTVDGNAVNLPAGPYYRVSGHAVIGLTTPPTSLTGDFVFEPRDTDSNPANGDEETVVGVANLALTFTNGTSSLLSVTNGSGAFVLTPTGIYGTTTATATLAVPGVGLTGTFSVLTNNTGAPVAARSVNVNGTTVGIPNLVAGPYVKMQATGAVPGDHAQLTVLGVTLAGDFLFESRTTASSAKVVTVAASNVSFDLGSVANNLLSITDGSGAFIMTASGLAGQGRVTLGIDVAGLTVGGIFTVAINQTNVAVNETVSIGGSPVIINLPAGPFLQINGTGATLGFMGVGLTGNFSFEQRTSADNTQLVTVLASNVSFNFGTSVITANNGSGFFILNDTGIFGSGQVDVHIPALSLTHTFTWAFNNTDPPIDQTVNVGGLTRTLTEPDGPFNRISTGAVPLSVTVGGQTESITAALVVTMVHPDNDPSHDYVTVGVSGLSMTLGVGAVNLSVSGGTGAFVIWPSAPTKLAGEVTVTSAALNVLPSVVSITATNLKLRVNNTGADVAPVSVSIDDNPADNVTVQFTGAYYHNYVAIAGAAQLVLPAGFVTLGGNFAIEVSNSDSNVLKIAATELNFDLKAGSTTVASFNHGSGELVISSAGVAGTASLQFQAGVIGMSGTIGLEVNTSNSAVNTIVTTPTGPVTVALSTTHYLKVNVNGYLRVGSLSLPYTFYVFFDTGSGEVQFWKDPLTELLSIDSSGNIALKGPLLALTNLDFAQPGSFEFVSMLKELGTWIDSFRSSSIFSTDIPFTGGKTLGDAFDWSQLFIDDLYSHLVSVELQSSVVWKGQPIVSTSGSTTFQLQLDSDPAVAVTIGSVGPFIGPTFTDGDVQSVAAMINLALPGTIKTRVVARENLAGQLVLALTDGEVAKGTKLSEVAADSNTEALGFGPTDSDATTAEHVAVLTSRYSTDGSGGTVGIMTVLSDLLNDGTINGNGTVNYSAAQQVYTFDVDTSKFLPTSYTLAVPLSFNQDFGPVANAQLNGKLDITASVGLHFTLGFDLGAADVPRVLSSSTTPTPANGQLADDAHFQVLLNGDPNPVNITLAKTATPASHNIGTSDNNSIDDLAADLNNLFAFYSWQGTPLNQLLIAQKAGTGVAISAKSNQLGVINRVALISLATDVFHSEVGFGIQYSQDGLSSLSASNSSIKGLFIDHANLSGALSLSPDLTYNPNGISGSFRFGFVDITVPSGTVQFVNPDPLHPTALTVGLSLQDKTTNATRFYISDLMHGTSSNNILNMVSGPNFAGGFKLQLNNIAVGGLGFSLPLGSNPQVGLFIPDITNLNYNPNPYDAASNKEGLFLTYPSLGDLQNFTSISFTQIIQALQAIAQNLSQLSAFSFLDQKLPLIDISVNDMIGYAAKFASLIDAASNGGSQSLQETITYLKTQIDQLFHLDPSILTISMDGIAPTALVTAGGDASHPSKTTIDADGDNNGFTLTANSNGATLNGSTIHIVGSSDVSGTGAQASWDATNKVLTIKINPGKTTANAIITALAGTPWTATLTATDDTKPNTGNGSMTTVALKFSMVFSTAYANSLPFSLDLKKLVQELGGTSPGIAAFLQAATTLVQIQGSGNLTVSASAKLTLDFGLDLTDPGNIRPFFYDTTGVVLLAKVLGTNINFQASLGSVVGIFIQNGSLTLDADGDPATNASTTPNPDKGAEFDLGLRDNNGDGRHYFDEDWFTSDSINLHLMGGVKATLPIFAPTQSVALGGSADTNGDGFPDNDLVVDIPDLVRFFTDTTASAGTAVVRIPGGNNDLTITKGAGATDNFTVVLQEDGSVGTSASATYAGNTLTVHINSDSSTAGAVQTAIQGTGNFTVTLTDPTGPNDGLGTVTVSKLKLITPDFSQLFNNLNFCDIIASSTGPLLDGLDALLGKIQDGLDSVVSGTKLPLIGDGLSGAASFIQNFRNGLLKELRDDVAAAGGNGLTAVQDAIKKAFWNSLGPGGLDILVNPDNGNALDPALGFTQLNVTLDCNNGLAVKLRLKKEIALVDTSGNPIKFDIGVPGFGLKGDGNLLVSVGFDLKFGFGVSPSDGFYFDTSAPASDPELQIYFKVSIPKLHFAGQLLFLQLDIADDTASPSSFDGHFSVDLMDPNNDGKLTFAEMTSSGTQLSDLVHAELGADAKVNLDLAASFGGNTAFPRVLAQFHLRWHFDVANGSGEPQISFDNIELDLGSFISDFLGPILAKIQDVTKPIQPIIDVATARIPILSDLAGHDITLLDLAQLFGLLEPSTVDFIKDVAQVITLINQLSGLGHGDILIPFGSFSLTGDSSGNKTQVTPKQSPNVIDLAQTIANDPDPGVSSSYQSAAAGFASTLGGLHNFSIPVFDHPSELFNLFVGKPVRLVEWRMPEFKFTFTYVQKIPIYPPLYAQFGGGIGATINIGFGYDTFGIQEFIGDPKKNPVDLLDGFYIITNDTNGQPQPALKLTGEIFAGASVDLVIVEVGVRGGVEATVNFFWNDNSDNDGKMRVSEIIANALDDPRCIFNIQGKIDLFLEAYLKINLFFFSIDKTWRFATITLVTFDLTCPEPVLGELSGSTLTLNIGSRAGLRLYDDTSDGPENFVVRHVDGDATSGETVDITFAQHRQEFKGVKDIEVPDAGNGDDVIDLRNVLSPSHLNGGVGNDTIYLSDGTGSTANGGAGDDKIVASSAASATAVVIHGDDGNDTITAGTVSITIYGDGGNDTITGSPQADMLYGGAGDDTITAGDGDDFVDAGAGNDQVDTGNGADFILGGAGDDLINAGPGDDVVDAGDDNDVVYGGAGNDLLIGGNGNDRMYGDGGSDLLIGDKVTTVGGFAITQGNLAGLKAAVGAIPTAGVTVGGIYGPDDGSSGNDFLVGGGGSDVIFGGNGDDFLYGGNFVANGDTAPIEEDNNDFIDGGPGNDTIFGDDSMGRTGDRNTGIAINSSIYYDQNLNGVRDGTETGLGGVTVWLYAASTPPDLTKNPGTDALATTKTDVDGSFQFVGLDPNNYRVVFSLPASLAFVAPPSTNVGDSATDSDAIPTTMNGTVAGETKPFFVDYDTTYKAVSAGYTGNAVVSIPNSSVVEGSTGQTQMTFKVTLSGPQASPVEVDYVTLDGNGVDPLKNATWESGDFVPVITAQKVMFNPGEISKQITILINGDTTYEANQQFLLQILSASRLDAGGPVALNVNNTSTPTTVFGTILNDDPIPSISIQDYNPGKAKPQFTVGDFVQLTAFKQTLSAAADPVSSFVWGKFSLQDQQLLSNPNTSDAQSQLTLVSELNAVLQGPSIYSPARFASVTLSHATNVLLLSAPTGDGLILLNRLLLQDAYPTDLARTIAGETEGAPAKFILTLSNPSEYPITVDWHTDASLTSNALPATDAATPSPLPGADFVSAFGNFGDVLHPAVSFTPGTTTQVITVATVDDNLSEGAEQFWVNLYNSRFATIADDRGYGIIQDNDPLPSVSIVPVTPVGGPFSTEIIKDPSSPQPVSFRVELSAPSGQAITVTWATSPGTATEGGPGDLVPAGYPNYPDLTDYVGFPTSTTPDNQKSLVFNPGDPLFQTVTVMVNPTKPYPNPTDTRTFFVNVLSADKAVIAADPTTESNHATVVIRQTVAPPPTDAGPWSVYFSSSSYDVNEPTGGGSTTANITIERTPGSSQAVAVFYTTDGTATAGVDYAPVFRQIVRFGADELKKTIPITIFDDGAADGDETVLLSLRNPTGGPVRAQPDTAVLTIHDSRTNSIWIEGPRLGTGLLSTTDFTDLTSLVSKLTAHTDKVSLFLWNNFSAADQAVLSNPSSTVAALQAALLPELNGLLLGPSIYGPARFAAVTLSRTTANLLAQTPAPVGLDLLRLNRWLLEDAYPQEIAKSEGMLEGSGLVFTSHDFIVHLLQPAGPGGVFVSYETVSLTARSDLGPNSDFTAVSGVLFIAAGSNQGLISVPVYEDQTPELSENFAVRLKNPIGAVLDPRDSTAIGTILDDDRKQISFNIFYDTNGNGFADIDEQGIPGLASALTVTFQLNGAPVTAVVTDAGDGVYTANVLLGQVSLVVDGSMVKSPYQMNGPGTTYQNTTKNENQSVKYQGIVGLPSFADVGYLIKKTTSVDKGTTKDQGRDGTDDTIFGGPGDDTIDAGSGDDHVVGGHWMTATDKNMPINNLATFNQYDAVVTATTTGLYVIYNSGPIFAVDTSGLNLNGSIKGQIWLDANSNNQQDPGELFSGQDVVVTLFDCDGNIVNQQVTNTGSYSFTKLFTKTPSDYVVQFDLPKGYTFVSPVGPPSAINSDVVVGGRTGIVTIDTGTPTVTDWDAGIRPTGLQPVVGGFQFSDPAYSVSEAVKGGVLTVTVQRGNAYDARAVVVHTQDGTAVQGVNYVMVSTLLQFNVGETTKTVDIPIINTHSLVFCSDPLVFTVDLRDPTGRPLDTATVYIGGQSYGSLHDDDTIQGGDDWDVILGDSGTIDAKSVMNVLATPPLGLVYSGGLGNDTINGGNGPDFINGQLGNDVISGDSGVDLVYGDMGKDTIYVTLDNDTVDGGYGFDTVISTRDVPTIKLESTPTVPDPTLAKLTHIDSTGTPLSTFTLSNIEMAQLFGGPADHPGATNNTFDVTNWNGSAFIVGGGGKDTLLVQNHIDMKLVDATLIEKVLYEFLYGFAKDAALTLASGGQYDLSSIENVVLTVTGGVGGNTIDASGYSRPVTFKDLDGNNTFIGGSGDDTFAFNADSLIGTETITGNGGRDTLDFSSTLVHGVTVDLSMLLPAVQNVALGLNVKLADKLENVTGGAGNDSLTGNDLDNVLIGGPGTDILAGGAGSETYVFDTDTQQGSKTIVENIADPGFDTLDFSGTTGQTINLNMSILGTPQVVNPNLTLTMVGEGIEQVIGGALNDVIRGNSNNNVLRGGPGADLLDGKSGDDVLDGGPGNNTLIGGPGIDSISEQGDTNFTLTDTSLKRGTGQIETLDSVEVVNLTGGAHANVFNLTGFTGTGSINGGDTPGSPRPDTIILGADANFILTDASLDTSINFAPIALTGIDLAVLTDGPGSHTLNASGFTGLAALNGGEGDDILIGGPNGDVIDGGPGTNTFIETSNASLFVLHNNSLLTDLTPASGDEHFTSLTNIQNVVLNGGPGANSFDLIGWTAGHATINGLGGFDVLRSQAPAVAAPGVSTVSLTDTSLTFSGSTSTITLNSIEGALITGTSGNDLLDASGFSGTVALHGGDGDDVLIAGSGTNLLDGGAGDDRLVFRQFGAIHSVFVMGGDGMDTLDFSGFNVPVAVDLSFLGALQSVAPGLLGINLLGATPDVENVIGGAGGGTLTGNSLDNTFVITGGVNTIDGGGGTNTILARADADFALTNASLTIVGVTSAIANIQVAKLTGGPGDNTLDASAFTGITVLVGGAGNDRLIGGSGDDLLIGGPGDDLLRGNAGNDTYQFNVDVPQGQDTVDETAGNGVDTLDFSPAHTVGVTVDLSLVTPQIVAPNLTLILTHGDSVENVIGTSQTDHLTGNALNNTFTGGAGNDVIDGGAGTDTIMEKGDASYVLTDTSLEIYRPAEFAVADITDLPGFVARLQSDANPLTQAVSNYLWSQFTSTAKQVLTDVTVALDQKTLILVGELNRIIQAGPLFDSVRFAGITLQADTQQLLAQNPTDQTLVRLNRWLVDDVYAGQIATRHQLDTLTSIESANLTGGAGDNLLDASAFDLGSVFLFGLDGNDTLLGGYGNDLLDGGNGDDVIFGGAGADVLLGGAGDDRLNGCGYFDITKGIPDGNDLLFGGTGNDTFVFDITAQKATPANPNPPAAIPQGTDVVIENFGGGFADKLVGIGPSVLAVDLFSGAAQNYYDANSNLILTLILANPGQVEFSF